nr:hypothetical protein [Brevibacillus antibioticus]
MMDGCSRLSALFRVIVPIMLLFAFCQKYLVEGLTQGAVKG